MKPTFNIHKALIAVLIQVFPVLVTQAQITSYFNTGYFNTPQNGPFVETYLTIIGNSIASKPVDGQFQNSVNVYVKITNDSSVVLTKNYNVIGAVFSNSLNAPSFIDVQRYPLPSGNYTVQLVLTDNNNLYKKSVAHVQYIKVHFKPNEINHSSIQLVESYSKSEKQGNLTKSGFDLVPYTVNYFPESMNQLEFYFETYHTDTVLGKDKSFVYSYYVENSQSLAKIINLGAFKKQKAAGVNPLLARMDISKLGTGNYNLVIELKDENNILHIQEKLFFQRLKNTTTPEERQREVEKNTVAQYFGACNSKDTLAMYVECLWPIADGLDKERIINQSIKKNTEEMKNYVINFWQRRAADTTNPLKLWSVYYKSVQEVMVLFKCGKQKGYYTDRGRVYLQYGKPSQRSIQSYEANTFPYEIWQYYRTTDESNGRFYSNRKFVFVNKAMGDDCFTLVHSDMPGELNNPRWQFEVTRRNNDGKANPDNNTPNGTEFNQMNEIYANPR